MTDRTYTDAEKRLILDYALKSERAHNREVVRVDLTHDDDVRAWCADGETYLVAPTNVLLEDAKAATV